MVRYGLITEASVASPAGTNGELECTKELDLSGNLHNQKLHEVQDWAGVLEKCGLSRTAKGVSRLSEWLGEMLPTSSMR